MVNRQNRSVLDDGITLAVSLEPAGGSPTGAPTGPVIKGKALYLFDEYGGTSKITIADVNQSNGVIHVVDHVLVPQQSVMNEIWTAANMSIISHT